MEQQTYVMIKPDAVARGLVGRIVARFEDVGLEDRAHGATARSRASRRRPTTPSTRASRSTRVSIALHHVGSRREDGAVRSGAPCGRAASSWARRTRATPRPAPSAATSVSSLDANVIHGSDSPESRRARDRDLLRLVGTQRSGATSRAAPPRWAARTRACRGVRGPHVLPRHGQGAVCPTSCAGSPSEYEVVGPVAKGDAFVFAPIDDPSRAAPRLRHDAAAAEEVFFPPEETMMRFRVADDEVVDDEVYATPRVLFGLHPCDINGLLLMDNVFLRRVRGPVLQGAPRATRCSWACRARRPRRASATRGAPTRSTGASTSSSPTWATATSCRSRSVKGAELLDRYVETRDVTDEDTAAFQRVTREFKEALHRRTSTRRSCRCCSTRSSTAPIWDELGERCLSCGACSMVCPTCYCFDVVDRLDARRRRAARACACGTRASSRSSPRSRTARTSASRARAA